jgi:hypothetical protein
VQFDRKKTTHCEELIIWFLCVSTGLSGYFGWLARKDKKQKRLIALTNRKLI